MTGLSRSRLILLAVCGLLLGAGVRWVWPSQDGVSIPTEIASLEAGDEYVFVYIGASQCVWANDPNLPELIALAKESVRDYS